MTSLARSNTTDGTMTREDWQTINIDTCMKNLTIASTHDQTCAAFETFWAQSALGRRCYLYALCKSYTDSSSDDEHANLIIEEEARFGTSVNQKQEKFASVMFDTIQVRLRLLAVKSFDPEIPQYCISPVAGEQLISDHITKVPHTDIICTEDARVSLSLPHSKDSHSSLRLRHIASTGVLGKGANLCLKTPLLRIPSRVEKGPVAPSAVFHYGFSLERDMTQDRRAASVLWQRANGNFMMRRSMTRIEYAVSPGVEYARLLKQLGRTPPSVKICMSRPTEDVSRQSNLIELEVEQEWSVQEIQAFGRMGFNSFAKEHEYEMTGKSLSSEQWMNWACNDINRLVWYYEQRFFLKVLFVVKHLPFCKMR
jgi:hypothetical protein